MDIKLCRQVEIYIDIVEAAVSSYLTKSTTLMERKQIFWYFSFSTHKVFKICSSSGLTNQKTTLYLVTVLKSVLGSDISKHLIFAHVFTYGVIQRLTYTYGMGKKAMIQKLIRGDPILVNCTYSTVL